MSEIHCFIIFMNTVKGIYSFTQSKEKNGKESKLKAMKILVPTLLLLNSSQLNQTLRKKRKGILNTMFL